MQVVVETKLTHARVHWSGAVCTRQGSAQLEQGMNKVYLTGVPRSVNCDSLKAKFPALVERGTVRVVDELPDELVEGEPAEALELRKRIERLRTCIDNRLRVREAWEANADFTSCAKVPAADRIAFLTELAERLDSLDAELVQLREEREDALKEYGRLAPGFDPESTVVGVPVPSLPKPSAVLLEVYAREAGECCFELQYQTRQAAWKPLYEVYADTLDAPLKLRLRGEVTQTTGEDWLGVTLELACSDMSATFGQAQLQPLYLDIATPVVRAKGMSRMMASAPVGSAAEDGAFCMEDVITNSESLVELAMPQASRQDQRLTTTYVLPGTWDVESTTTGRVVDIQSDDVQADFRMLCIPGSDTSAYLTASLHDAESYDLFACRASLYLEGTFMGATDIDPDRIAAGEALPLGRDERIHVERTRTRKYTSNTMLSGKTKTEYTFAIKMRNRRGELAHMIVYDQLPVSRNKDIEVHSGELSKAEVDEKTGILRWEFDLNAGEERIIEFDYTVVHPKNKQIEESRGPSIVTSARMENSLSTVCPYCGADASGAFCPNCGSAL